MLHLIKLAPGCDDIKKLRERMASETSQDGKHIIHTRTMPKRAQEIVAGGSIYRVMAGMIAARQTVNRFEPYTRHDGHKGTMILVEPKIITVQPRPMRPFQGWRYLKEEDAPPDLSGDVHASLQEMPDTLKKSLAALCLI